MIVFRRFRNTNPATMMIASFALGFAIRNLLLMLYSSRPKSITLWPSLSLPVEFLGARIPMLQVVTIVDHAGGPGRADAVPQTHALRSGDARRGR